MKITRLPRTIRNLSRLYEILKVVAKHGFDDVAGRLDIGGSWRSFKHRVSFGRLGGQADEEIERYTTEERIRRVLEELGSTYVKLGQILATRPDLIPMSLIHELRKLQDDVPAFDPNAARQTVEEELGAGVDELFSSFEPEPLAAASIAQVHRATLKSGDEVVVKVQRPGLRQKIRADLDLLHLIAELAEERIPELRRWQPTAIVAEFDKSIHREIDFGREAHNIRKFAKNFEGDPGIYAPRVYDDLSTERVLTMEFIKGVKMTSEGIASREGALDRETVARTGIRCILRQVFVHGFFHADPHPGNVFVMDGNVVCLLDFGMMGQLDQERIDDLLAFLVAVLTNNPERMIRLFVRQGLVDERVDDRALRGDIADLMDRYLGVQVQNIDVATYIQQLFEIITRYRIVLPADLLLMGKSLATIDGIARDVYPELDPLSAIRPQILSIYFRRLTDPDFYMRDTRRAIEDAALLLQRLPREARVAMEKLRRGELTVRVDPRGPAFDAMVTSRNRSLNRLAAAIAIVGLAAVSSYLMVSTVSTVGFHRRVDHQEVVRLEGEVSEAAAALRRAEEALAGAADDAKDAAEEAVEGARTKAEALKASLADARDPGLTTGGSVLFWLAVLGYLLASWIGLGFLWGLFRSGGFS